MKYLIVSSIVTCYISLNKRSKWILPIRLLFAYNGKYGKFIFSVVPAYFSLVGNGSIRVLVDKG